MSSRDVNFTGRLVRRQYKPGQKYVQLIFKTDHENKISLSRNPRLVKALKVGATYKISGQQFTLGDKSFIKEPRAIPVSDAPRSKKWLMVASGFATFILIGGVVSAVALSASNGKVPTKTVAQAGTVQGASTTVSPSADSTAQPAPSSPSNTPTTPAVTSTRKSTNNTASSSSSSNTNPTTPATNIPDTNNEIQCSIGEILVGGVCVMNPPTCSADQTLIDGICVDNPTSCEPGYIGFPDCVPDPNL